MQPLTHVLSTRRRTVESHPATAASRFEVQPGLRVSLTLAAGAALAAQVRVAGGTAPFRLFLYVDGALAATSELPVEDGGPVDRPTTLPLAGPWLGRHAVTVRVIDAAGRWGGASGVLAVATGASVEATPLGGKAVTRSATALHSREADAP